MSRWSDDDWAKARVLTVRQPWCDAIVDGHKPVENRATGFPKGYRGLLLVHAGSALARDAYADERIRKVGCRNPVETGSVIGLVDVVDIHLDTGCCEPWGESEYSFAGGKVQRDVTHLILEDPVRLDHPVPASGSLGLWFPDPVVKRRVRAQYDDRATAHGQELSR